MDVESEEMFAMPTAREPSSSKKKCNTKRYDTPHFAMACDRFGIGNRVASFLATSLFKDIDFKDENGEPIIMDKSKVSRERKKCRDSLRAKQRNDCDLVAFSFDGRKNNFLSL